MDVTIVTIGRQNGPPKVPVNNQVASMNQQSPNYVRNQDPLVANRRTGLGEPPPFRTLGSNLFSGQAWIEIGRALRLSGRETQIARGILDDRTEFAIAADLCMSPHTVHTHMQRLHRKLAVVTRVGLVLRLMDQFLRLTASSGNALPPICGRQTLGRCPLLLPLRPGFQPG